MDKVYKHRTLLLVIAVALLVYCFAHWDSLCSPYVINDDVRQQVYWMQAWQSPELYQNHYLTEYARNYVPWGVQIVYWLASHFINPVSFSKILTALLFVTSAGLLFILASRMRDELTGIAVVCAFFHFGFFLGSVSGGLSRGFVFPLLILYLICLSRKNTVYGGVVLMIQSLLNPYVFVLCLFTHGLYLVHNVGFKRQFDGRVLFRHLLELTPVIVGGVLFVAKYLIFQSPEFGSLVSEAEMIGHPEYTAEGRYEIIPVPSVFFELLRPFLNFLPIGFLGISAAVAGGCLFVFLIFWGNGFARLWKNAEVLQFFVYLLLASVVLYFFAKTVLFELFLPRRYLEYSLTVFYCIVVGLLFHSAIESITSQKIKVSLLVLVTILGALRLYGVGIYDYRAQLPLYSFFQTTSPHCIIAGHPGIMDNVMTFSRRKVFLSYELSHPWYDRYWSIIKPWTSEFFSAYYTDNPNEIRTFCRNHAIDYFVVREADFIRSNCSSGSGYFEPFGSQIKNICREKSSFAVLDETVFKPVYQHDGIRIITP